MSDWALISESTASGASSVSFTDLTGYKIFKFVFIDVNPATNLQTLRVAFSTDSGSSYTTNCTSTFFEAGHHESSGWTAIQYLTSEDVAQSYPVKLHREIGNGADESSAGELFLFNPASPTYVKNFYSRANVYSDSYTYHDFSAGYANTTSAVNALQFTVASGNFDGTIKSYGLVAT
tara:strand:+ start:590 stop:1120 length:531 start_codon:yes stop_codon:yes gene_type:complete